ncbi:hypothetical protein GGF44_006612, partial [Coemansia sp. RSA 1694]
MSQVEFVDWIMRECCAYAALSPVLDALAGYMIDDAELRSAWNAWWAQNMLVAPRGLMSALVRSHSESFDYSVVLAAVYLVGGPCSSASSARVALEAVAALLGVISHGRSVALEQPIFKALSSSATNEVRNALCALSDDEVATV